MQNTYNKEKVNKIIPNEYIEIYSKILHAIEEYNKELINKIYNHHKGDLIFPLGTELIENYLEGFEIRYISVEDFFGNAPLPSFCNLFDGGDFSNLSFDGCWFRLDNKTFQIIYKSDCVKQRQLFTKVHELIHVCQRLDPLFLEEIDEVLKESILPQELVDKLIESVANKATAEYLMPREYFENKFKETQNLQELADYFGVSVQSVKIRITSLKLDNFMDRDF